MLANLCVKVKKFVAETFENSTEAYGDAILWRIVVFRWHKAVKEGQGNIEDHPRSGRSVSSTKQSQCERLRVSTAVELCAGHFYFPPGQSIRLSTKNILKRLRKEVQRVRRGIADA